METWTSECEEGEEDARLSKVFEGVLTSGKKRKAVDFPPGAGAGAPRPKLSHAFFYLAQGRVAPTRPPPPPMPVCEGNDDETALEREARLMVSLGLPAALVQGTAASSDRDGSAYKVLAVRRTAPPAHRGTLCGRGRAAGSRGEHSAQSL